MGFGAHSPKMMENLQHIRSRILEEPAILAGVRKQMGDRYGQTVEACIRDCKAIDTVESAER